jgi:uncharacterized membrane protein YhaH (DUF805 family)
MISYLSVLAKYARFAGRARRQEYWMFALVNLIISAALETSAVTTKSSRVELAAAIYGVAVILPSLAVLVRRLHDTGRSGAWFWIVLLPFIGGLWLLILTVIPGNLGVNRYGPDPKSAAA